MNRWLDIIQNCLYPPTCVLCGDPGADNLDLCHPCRLALPYNLIACSRCGEVLDQQAAQWNLCGRCLKAPPAFDEVITVLRYQDPASRLIQDLKFGAAYANARLLGMLLATHVAESRSPLPECLIPVPLHRQRYRRRGFNQAAEIARHVAKALDIPLALGCCERTRATPSQSQLPAKARCKNLKGAFQVVMPPKASHVALIDDVITTAATVSELAVTLKNAGIERVDAWACARA